MNEATTQAEFIPADLTAVALYDDVRAKMNALKETSNSLVFDYNMPAGNKAARSHIYSLKLINGDLERARKAAKEKALAYGKLVDSKAKEIGVEIDNMIEVHAKPLRELEEKEAARVENHNRIRQHLEGIGNGFIGGQASAFGLLFAELDKIVIDASLEEFEEPAKILKAEVTAKLQAAFEAHKVAVAEKAELERLRQESAERARKDHEEKIAREAAERATKEAEAKAERDRIATEQAAINAKRQQEAAAAESERKAAKAIADAKLAQEQAEKRAKDAEEAARNKLAAEREAERQAEFRRENNKTIRLAAQGRVIEFLVVNGVPSDYANKVVSLIADKLVPHVSISY